MSSKDKNVWDPCNHGPELDLDLSKFIKAQKLARKLSITTDIEQYVKKIKGEHCKRQP